MTHSREPTSLELLTFKELQAFCKIRSRQSIYNYLRKDPTFPRARRAGKRLVWLRSEVEAWQRALPVAEFDGTGCINLKTPQAA